MNEVKDCPLVMAISNVMGSVGKLGKDNLNKFDNYKFTSIDDFMAATGKACSENDIVVVQDEVSREIITKKTSKGESQWLLLGFTFTVKHSSKREIGPVSRSVAVPFTGAQSFGSAQSYALKQFMRSLFQIATGDTDDPDYGPQNIPVPDSVSEKITEETIQDIYAIVDPLPAFPTQEIFRSWVRVLKGKSLDDLTDDEGKALFTMLQEKPDVSQWNETLVNSLTEVMKVASETTSQAPF